MPVEVMIEWPGKCAECGRTIDDWSDAGLLDRRWVHKACWGERFREVQGQGAEIPALRSPLERSRYLEWPMFGFLMLFHFGLGAAVAGWVMLTQGRGASTPGWVFFTDNPDVFATVLLVAGLVVPAIGLAGAAINILSRRRIELIRGQLEAAGGWKPGR
jgi:hypothetical protein